MYDFFDIMNRYNANSIHNINCLYDELKTFKKDTDFGGGFILLLNTQTGRILLAHRGSGAHFQPDTWFCLGGTMEENESPMLTAFREVWEEGSLLPEHYEIVKEPLYIHKDIDEKGDSHSINIYIGLTSNDQEVNLNHEHIDSKWFKLDDLHKIPLFISLEKCLTDDKCIRKIISYIK